MLSGYYPKSLETSCIPSRTCRPYTDYRLTTSNSCGTCVAVEKFKIASSFARNLRVLTSKRLLPILRAASQFLGEIFSRFRSQNNSANYAGKRSVIEEAHKEQGLAQMVQMWGIL